MEIFQSKKKLHAFVEVPFYNKIFSFVFISGRFLFKKYRIYIFYHALSTLLFLGHPVRSKAYVLISIYELHINKCKT